MRLLFKADNEVGELGEKADRPYFPQVFKSFD